MTRHSHFHSPAHDPSDETGLADLLDLDGEVLHSYWTDALRWVQLQAGTDAGRILDLGAGAGTGTIGLARQFGAAEVIAVDISPTMLARVERKAQHLARAERVRTIQADLDSSWPAVGILDIIWASLSIHHLADPDRVLRDCLAALRPGGLFALAEFDQPARLLPDDLGLGRPGLETRCLEALGQEHAHSVPELGSDWAPRLAAAGFEVISERRFEIDLTAPVPRDTARYAQLWFGRIRSVLAHRLAPDDVAALAVLIDGDGPDSLARRGDLHVRGSRTVTLARRP